MWRIALVAVVALAPRLALAKRRPEPTHIALFPLLQVEGVDPAIVAATNDVLAHERIEARGISVLAGATLDARLGTSAVSALTACGDNVGCVIGLGKKLHAKSVVIGRARANEAGARVIFVTFDVATGALGQKISVDFPSSEEVALVLGGSLYALVGIHDPGFIEVTGIEPEVQVVIDGQVVGKGAKRYALAPGRRSVALGDVTSVVTIAPGRTLTMHRKSASEASSEPNGSGHIEVPVLVGFSEVPGLVAPTRMERNPYLFYTGIGVAGGGVVALIVATALGVASHNQAVSANAPTTTQVAAVRLDASARGNATGANVAFVIGGVALALGASAFGSAWAFPLPKGTTE